MENLMAFAFLVIATVNKYISSDRQHEIKYEKTKGKRNHYYFHLEIKTLEKDC